MEETNTKKIKCSACKDAAETTEDYGKPICKKKPTSAFHIQQPTLPHLQLRMKFIKDLIDNKFKINWGNCFIWDDTNNILKNSSGSKLLELIYNLLYNHNPLLDKSHNTFLMYMTKAILQDQYHDFYTSAQRIIFDNTKCTDIFNNDKIVGLQQCLMDKPQGTQLLSNSDISTYYKDEQLLPYNDYLITPKPGLKLVEYVEYMITDMSPNNLLEDIKGVKDIYTIARLIDSAPCSANIKEDDKLFNCGVSQQYEYIITNLALAFYQSFFKELNDFTIYIDCDNDCISQHTALFKTTKMFSIIIKYNSATHTFNAQGGDKGDFTVPRITRTLAVSTQLCHENIALMNWLNDDCKLSNDKKETVIINLHTLMKGFGDFCQMFMCLFLYFIRILKDDGTGEYCKLNKNIILATNDTFLKDLAQLCNCPYILGSSEDKKLDNRKHCKLYINSNSTYLGKQIIDCWNKMYSIELINADAVSSVRKERQIKQTFGDTNYCFCKTTSTKFTSGEVFVNNFLQRITEYCENVVIFEKEFAILVQKDREIILYLSPVDIRFTDLTTIIKLYTNDPLYSLTSTQNLTFTLTEDYDITTFYDESNITIKRTNTRELYAFFDFILTAYATCKFYENICTNTSGIVIRTTKPGSKSVSAKVSVELVVVNETDKPSAVHTGKLNALIDAPNDLLIEYLVKLKSLTPSSAARSSSRVKSGPVADLAEINFAVFVTSLDTLNDTITTVDYETDSAFINSHILDPIIAFAKSKEERSRGKKSKGTPVDQNADDILVIFGAYYETNNIFSKSTMKYESLKNFLTNYAKKFRMYKDLLFNMEKQFAELSNMHLPSLIVAPPNDPNNIIEKIKTDLSKYIKDIKLNIVGLEEKYDEIKKQYIDKIISAKSEFDKILNYIKTPPAKLNDTIKNLLEGFKFIFEDAETILKDMLKNIAIINGNCLDICDDNCEKDDDGGDPPGGPGAGEGMSVEEAGGPSGKGGGYRLMDIEQLSTHKQITKNKKYSKKTFKGGVNLEDALNSYPDLLNLCKNYELNHEYLHILKNKESDLLRSERFTYILLSNDMLVDMNLKVYSHRLFYNYFTYILIWIFTRYLENSINKFSQFIECYRLLITEKHLQLGNFVNMYFYYFNKSHHPSHKLYADNLLDHFKKYETLDLINLEKYYNTLNILRQKIIDFPHNFNEFIKVTLNLEEALPYYDSFQSQYGDNPVVILNNMIPIYIRLFENHVQMYITWVIENFVLNLFPLQNMSDMPTFEIIANTILSNIKLKRSEFDDIKHKVKSLDNKIKIIDAKINKPRNTQKADKNPAKGGQRKETRRARVQTRKKLTRTIMQPITGKNVRLMKELDSFKTEIKSKFENLEKINNDIIYAKILLSKLDRLSLIIENYKILNTYIETNYLIPETPSTIGENLRSINNYILTPHIIKHIYDTFNEFNNMLIKHIRKIKLSKKITNIDAKITAQKAKVDNPKNTQRAKKTAKEEQRKETRLANINSRKQLTKTNARLTTDAEKVKLKEFNRLYKLKELKRTQKLEYREMGGGVHTVSKSHAKDKANEKVSLSKYKIRVEQYKNKEFTSYFEKKLKTYINDPTVDIYKIGMRKMQSILKNIYNIAK